MRVQLLDAAAAAASTDATVHTLTFRNILSLPSATTAKLLAATEEWVRESSHVLLSCAYCCYFVWKLSEQGDTRQVARSGEDGLLLESISGVLSSGGQITVTWRYEVTAMAYESTTWAHFQAFTG